MNTFLPYPDFLLSVRVLDYRRLGKQRVEARQILNVLEAEICDPTVRLGWCNHPAVRMWRGYASGLAAYMDETIKEWVNRGYKNSIEIINPREIILPPWFGRDDVHASHRSNLLRKDPIYYGKFGWSEARDLPYVWPM